VDLTGPLPATGEGRQEYFLKNLDAGEKLFRQGFLYFFHFFPIFFLLFHFFFLSLYSNGNGTSSSSSSSSIIISFR